MNEIDYIDTDNILKGISEFKIECHGDKPTGVILNPKDIRYLKSNMGYGVVGKRPEIFGLEIVEDLKINIGEFRIIGMPRLKKW